MGLFRVYTVYDEKAEDFSPPFFQQNDRLAMRTLTESMKGNNLLGAYPEDFKLYCIGEFNSAIGKIVGLDVPKLVCIVKDLTKNINPGGVRHVEN